MTKFCPKKNNPLPARSKLTDRGLGAGGPRVFFFWLQFFWERPFFICNGLFYFAAAFFSKILSKKKPTARLLLTHRLWARSRLPQNEKKRLLLKKLEPKKNLRSVGRRLNCSSQICSSMLPTFSVPSLLEFQTQLPKRGDRTANL